MQEISHRIQAQGKRMTEQRRLILETLKTVQGHPTAEELYQLVKQRAPNLHLSTVYRTMRWLEEEGMVNSLWLDDERRQERFDTSYSNEHHHFVCTRCKQVVEFDSQDLLHIQDQYEQEHGVQVENASLVFYGLCQTCLRDTPGHKTSQSDS
jgi:Fe2+ or Zn2+ uptake regulation protein